MSRQTSSSQLESPYVFGVRHLSPGGARHLLETLETIRPTCVLIEGPSDASGEIPHLTRPETKPPVAILAFTEELPVRTVLWPFAVYSPEYQAMKWAADNGAACAFIDLPTSVVLALGQCRVHPVEPEGDNGSPAEPDRESHDPSKREESVYKRIARLAGEDDYETYWERNFEHNGSAGAYRTALHAFSASLRELTEEAERINEQQEFAKNAVREAYMRRQIAQFIDEGHEPGKIVVICGAYHAAEMERTNGIMSDEELALLPSVPSKLTLMPYSYYKLSSMSGYGAGNEAPYYYQQMWEAMTDGTPEDLPYRYLSSAARMMRERGTHRSTAEVIEAVRMAESLAALHGGSAPVLKDLRDAALTLLGRGELSAVADSLARLDVGTAIGELAEGVSQTPIQDDLNRQFKQLKLEKYKTPVAADLPLDLRENRRVSSAEAAYLDLNRSFLLHRLVLLGVPFAERKRLAADAAAWKEEWVARWTPETEIQVVEATLLGETVELAAAYVLKQRLEACTSVAEAASLIRIACECGMTRQLGEAVQTLQRLAADSRDVVQMASAASGLSAVIGFGDIRKIDTAPLVPLMEQLFHRSALYLVDASGCNDEAATGMITAMNELSAIASAHHEAVDEALWEQELGVLAERDDRNPRLSGFACAILMERGKLSAEECGAEVSRRLSPGIPAELGAGWFEGLSLRNRYALLSRMSLWEQLNSYIASLDREQFMRALVFLRRAFSAFSPGEKIMVAELLGELWGIHPEEASVLLTDELKEEENQMIDELNDFDFGDF